VITLTEPTMLSEGSVTTVDPLCTGSTGEITLGFPILPTGGVPPYTYSEDNGMSNQVSNVFIGVSGGSYNSYQIIDNNGCSINYPSIIINNPSVITIDAGLDQTQCSGIDIALSGTLTNASGIVWSSPTQGSTGFDDNTLLNAVYTPNAIDIANGTVSLTMTHTGSCGTYMDDVQISITIGPEIDLTTTNVVNPSCGNSGMIDIELVSSTGAEKFSLNGGAFQVSSVFSGLASGTYTVMVIDTLSGCASANQNFVLTSSSSIEFEWIKSDMCLPDSGTFEFINVTGGMLPYQYSIDGGNNWSNSNVFNGLDLGQYQLTVRDALSCIKDTTDSVTFNGPPTPTITSVNPYCAGNIVLTGSGVGNLFWVNDQSIILSSGATFSDTAGSLMDAQTVYLIDQVNGCNSQSDFQEIEIVLNDLSAGDDQTVCAGDSVVLNATSNLGQSIVSWQADPTINDNTAANTMASPVNLSTYYVAILSAGTCQFKDSILVTLDPSAACETDITNAFSPNDDGLNDSWIIDKVNDHPLNTVSIFDRWGSQVRYIVNYDNVSNVWKGFSDQGNSLPIGTYYYVIEFEDTNGNLTGWIQITR